MTQLDATSDLERIDVAGDALRAGFHRLFHAHVLASVMTALVVIPLLLGIASIPAPVSLAYCSAIVLTAIAFVVAAVAGILR